MCRGGGGGGDLYPRARSFIEDMLPQGASTRPDSLSMGLVAPVLLYVLGLLCLTPHMLEHGRVHVRTCMHKHQTIITTTSSNLFYALTHCLKEINDKKTDNKYKKLKRELLEYAKVSHPYGGASGSKVVK